MYLIELAISPPARMNIFLQKSPAPHTQHHPVQGLHTNAIQINRFISTKCDITKKHTLPGENIKIKWTFDESGPREKYRIRKHKPVDVAGMRNYYMWRRIVLSGCHPGEAAHMAGSQFCFKQVKQKNQLYSIKLNIEHQVFFYYSRE
ncbi:hypothetical protein [Enterobacter roggenkampii]|uniref:hypothetical protein n=1 Tax=Enterobacter roggenkampii TaxID=1812935 RepID=UPI0013B45DA3|nr:hypothetical protein [Enterobacter roggenkampii]